MFWPTAEASSVLDSGSSESGDARAFSLTSGFRGAPEGGQGFLITGSGHRVTRTLGGHFFMTVPAWDGLTSYRRLSKHDSTWK